MTWEKRENVALQEEVPRVCPEPQVYQVIQVLPALGGMAGMVSEALKGRQAFLVCPVPQALLALLVSASQPPAPCRLVSEPLAKGQSSERLSAAWLSA